MQPERSKKKKVAIVGSGCAGLGAAWALKSTEYEIHLFEREARLGGHTNTQKFDTESGPINVDTGFIVMNTATYPNFINFLRHVNVPTTVTEMSFAVSRDSGAFEWSGSASGLFAQRRNFFRLRHWQLLFDVIRFNQFALDLLFDDDSDEGANLTIGQYLDQQGYSQTFKDDYLIPMTAAVWSTSPDKASLEFPARTLVRFMWNHHLLSTVAARPDWLTIPGGSRQYIDAIIRDLGPQLHIHKSCRVTGLVRPPADSKDYVAMAWTNGDGQKAAEFYDHVILACHGDQILPIVADEAQLASDLLSHADKLDCCKEMLVNSSENNSKASVTSSEFSVLSSFQTTPNICYLHSDPDLLPTRIATWSSWNYLISSSPSHQSHPAGVSLTYNMNILQHIPYPLHGHVLVTMNPPHPPRESLTRAKFEYRHPLYTTEAVKAQQQLQNLQGARGVSYCGAWTGYGFHEDGFTSGLRVAKDNLGAQLPFEFRDAKFSRGNRPLLSGKDYLLRIAIFGMQAFIAAASLVASIPLIWLPLRIALNLFERLLKFLEEVGLID